MKIVRIQAETFRTSDITQSPDNYGKFGHV